MSGLKVGFAQVDYTPEVGLPMVGNFRDDYASRGVHDSLCAHAMVFACGGRKAAVVSLDICILQRQNVAVIRQAVESQCDLAGENVLVAATHTHAGPATFRYGRVQNITDDEINAFLRRAAVAVVEANANLADGALRFGKAAEDRVSFNRRIRCADGVTRPNWECVGTGNVAQALGPIDPDVLTLAVRRNGGPAAAMVNFALHPAILAGDNWLYSADYAGYLCEAMAKIYGEGFLTAFFNGCCGNLNHIDCTDATQGRGAMMAQRVGYMLATTAQQAISGDVRVKGDAVAVSRETVRLPRVKISDEQHAWSLDTLEKAKANPRAGQVDGLPDEHYAMLYLDLHEVQHEDDQVEVMAVRVGDTALAGLPGEVFCEFGMEIKQRSPATHTMVLELANDGIGYLPTRNAFEEGGYEPSIGVSKYEPGAGEKLTDSALRQLDALFA